MQQASQTRGVEVMEVVMSKLAAWWLMSRLHDLPAVTDIRGADRKNVVSAGPVEMSRWFGAAAWHLECQSLTVRLAGEKAGFPWYRCTGLPPEVMC